MQVVVDRLESTNDLHVHLSPSTMSRLQIDDEDVIKIASPAKKYILVAVTSKGFQGADNSICIGRNFRQLLECYLGETVTIEPFKFCQIATKVVFAPISDTMNHIKGNFLSIIKNSNIDFTNIPVFENMVIPIYAMQHVFEFRVVECKPIMAVIVADPDVIQCQNEPVERARTPVFDRICYDDIGGIDSQLLTIRKLVENPRTSSALIVAPSGCGKTYLSQAIRNETKSHFEFIPALQLLGLKYERAKNSLVRALEVTAQNTPAIVYIDDLDSIAGIQNYDGDQPDDRLINSFDQFIDRLRKMPNVLVLATTKSIENLRSDFHPPTCFNEAIKIDIPNRQERSQILRAITRKMTLKSPNAIEDMASMTEGQTPSDLLLICHRTILSHLNEVLNNFDVNNPTVRLDDLRELAVGQAVYSSPAASAKNKKKKSKSKDGSKKESRISNLDPFSDLLSQQGNENSNSDDDDNDNDNEEDNFTFPLNGNNGRGSPNPFAQNADDKKDADDMFGFGINAQKDSNNGGGNSTDIFGASKPSESDPFASKSSDPFSIPGSGGGFPMNDPFSGPGGSSTAAATAAAVAGNGFGIGNPYGQSSSSSTHHKKRSGDDEKKHKKHKKHNKSKREDSGQSSAQSGQIPQNPFNTVQNQGASGSNNDPFGQTKQQQSDPFASPQLGNGSSNADPFAVQSKPPANMASVDPFAAQSKPPQSNMASVDPFAAQSKPSPANMASVDPFGDPFSTSQKRPGQSSDPFATDNKRYPNEDPFNLSSSPRNRANNPDPFAPSNSSKDSGGQADPFALSATKRVNKGNDPFAPGRSRAARESIDPFAPPVKK